MTQKRWGKDRSRVAKDILDGKLAPSVGGVGGPHRVSEVTPPQLEVFWKGVFEAESEGDSRPVVPVREPDGPMRPNGP